MADERARDRARWAANDGEPADRPAEDRWTRVLPAADLDSGDIPTRPADVDSGDIPTRPVGEGRADDSNAAFTGAAGGVVAGEIGGALVAGPAGAIVGGMIGAATGALAGDAAEEAAADRVSTSGAKAPYQAATPEEAARQDAARSVPGRANAADRDLRDGGAATR